MGMEANSTCTGLMLDKDRWRPPSQNRGFAVPEVGRVAHPDGASGFEAEHSRSSVVFTRQVWPQSNRQKPRPTAAEGRGRRHGGTICIQVCVPGVFQTGDQFDVT